jgi:high-affinity iron transporter
MILLLALPWGAWAEEAASTRWADAADEIDKFLDAAFESYLDGDGKTAYDNVSNAYFRVYETTGFERQTMSYVSGNRKNAVEMQFSACKAAVKKENTDQETIVSVRSALQKLKAMIREDGNKLAALQGGAQSETKYYKRGELVTADPYPEYSADPNAAQKYASWYEAATLVKELLDTAYMGYLDKDFEAALDNLNTAFYSVYEESGLSHKIYTDLSLKDRQKTDGYFSDLRGLVASASTISEPVFSASCFNVPNLNAAGVLLRMNSAPSSWQRSAMCQAMDFSSNAPKMIPFLPLRRLYIIIFFEFGRKINDFTLL